MCFAQCAKHKLLKPDLCGPVGELGIVFVPPTGNKSDSVANRNARRTGQSSRDGVTRWQALAGMFGRDHISQPVEIGFRDQ
jgi:hypothetical protein